MVNRKAHLYVMPQLGRALSPKAPRPGSSGKAAPPKTEALHLDKVSLPSSLRAFVLLFQPFQQRLEIGDQGRGIHFAAAGEGFQGIGPGFGGTHREHSFRRSPTALLP